MQSIKEILDFQLEKQKTPPSRTVFTITPDQHDMLCHELKRNVKKYKGARVMVIKPDENGNIKP